jgi:hypothetical protein
LFLFIFCILNCLALVYFFQKVNAINAVICEYIEAQYPELWHHFLVRGRLMGNEKKWAKHLAIASMTDGELSHKNDVKLTAYFKKHKSYYTSLAMSPMILLFISSIFSGFA